MEEFEEDLGQEDKLFSMVKPSRGFVILHFACDNLCYLDDGTNAYLTNEHLRAEVDSILGCAVLALRYEQQVKAGPCGSSAVASPCRCTAIMKATLGQKRLLCRNKGS